MTDEETELAQRLTTLPGWAWRPGMMGVGPGLIGPVQVLSYPADVLGVPDSWVYKDRYQDDPDMWLGDVMVPNLHDDATAGVLLSMLRAAVPDGHAVMVCAVPDRLGWAVGLTAGQTIEEWPWDADHLGVAVARALLEVLGE